MIKIENTVVPSNEQWRSVILGARNPKNSWDRYDSKVVNDIFVIGPNDYSLLTRLAKSGTEHRKYMRGLTVSMDVTAPLYWWKEFDQHKIGTTTNSCSTMHKIHSKEFTLDDFSCEHLITGKEPFDEESDICFHDCNLDRGEICAKGNFYEGRPIFPYDILMNAVIPMLNECRTVFLDTKDKRAWWQMIQLLPSSYNQRRTVMLNYEVLAGIYPKRKDHKLDEWHTFCDWTKSLPYSEIITLEEMNA